MRSERGSAMVTSLLAVAVLSILAATTYRLTRTLVRETTWQMRSAQAHAIAEAGLEDALLQVLNNPSWTAGFTNKPFAGGAYTVVVTPGTPPTLSATGYSKSVYIFGPAVRSVTAQAALRSGSGGGAPAASLAAGSQVKVDGLIDAYDSTVNPSPASFTAGAGVYSNGQVVTKEGVGIRIRGNVVYMSGAGPKTSTVEGTITFGASPIAIPNSNGAAYASANDNLTGLSPLSVYISSKKELNVPSGTTATLQPGRYYFSKMTVAGTLVAAPGAGTVEIYVAGSSDFTGTFSNSSLIPSKLKIYPQGNVTLQFKSSAPLHAVIEGAQAAVSFDQEFYGTVGVNTVDITSSGKVHLDTLPSSVTGAAWAPGSWATGYDRP